ncbi:MAG: hypothetical protein U0X93_12645 [Anaerolineales bacterium]
MIWRWTPEPFEGLAVIAVANFANDQQGGGSSFVNLRVGRGKCHPFFLAQFADEADYGYTRR